jgi:fucose 4-O-acetylase-like acetyltransferase
MSKQRLEELDLAKGLAIFLVVLGHVVTGREPVGNEWYGHLRMFVYEFHMPLFMVLSGAIFQVTFRPGSMVSAWTFISSRAKRLLPAFAIFSVVIWAGKHLAAEFQTVDNFDSRGWGELLEIYTSPTTSVARSLWYIYVLLELYALFAIISTVTAGRLAPAFAVAVLMRVAFQFAEVPAVLALNSLCEYAIFFVIGVAFARSYNRLMPLFRQNSLSFYGIFAASFLTMLVLPHPWTKGLIGLASIPAALAFASSFTSPRDKRTLLLMGEYTFTIYLMNTLFIGFFKGALLTFLPWDGPCFVVYFFVLLTAGTFGPIALHRLLLTRIPMLARITK